MYATIHTPTVLDFASMSSACSDLEALALLCDTLRLAVSLLSSNLLADELVLCSISESVQGIGCLCVGFNALISDDSYALVEGTIDRRIARAIQLHNSKSY